MKTYFPAGVFTTQNTGVYNLVVTIRSGSQVADTDMYLEETR